MWWARRENLWRALAVLALASSTLAFVAVIASSVSRLVYYEGYTLSGWVSLLGYDLRVLGDKVSAPPLDSVSIIAATAITISLAGLALVAAATASWLRRWEAGVASFAASASVASALSLSLLYSLLRVVVYDVLPHLPARGSFLTTAGRLYLEESLVSKSAVLVLYERLGFALLVWAGVSLVLAVVLAYRVLRAEEPRLS